MSAPNFWGGVCSKFLGGDLLQIFGGGVCSKFFWGGVSNFWNIVNIRPVCILLECILVNIVSMEMDRFTEGMGSVPIL